MPRVITIDPGKSKCGLVLAEISEKKVYKAIILKSESLVDYVRNLNNVEDISPNDGSTVERKRWLNGDNCSSVQELKVIGGDHDWPGIFGNMDIDATNEIWNFVSKYDINGLIDCNSVSGYEFDINLKKKLIRITDIFARDIKKVKNIPLFYHYNNGEVEKKIILE